MATGIVYPLESSVEEDGFEAIPPALVGGSGALSDESDDTYAEGWLCNRPPGGVSGGITGSAITGIFAAQPDAVSATPVNIRLATANEQNATEGWISILALNHATGLQFASTEVLVSPGERVVVTADFAAEGTLFFDTLRTAGVRIVAIRLQTPGNEPPADYKLTVYRMWMDVTISGDGFPTDDGTGTTPSGGNQFVTRLYPRDDGRGLSSAARIHPPTKARRKVGGYR